MRKFKCIGLKENVVRDWIESFTIGKIYYEKYNVNINEKELYLTGNEEIGGWYVDADQFEEVKS